MSDSFFSRRLPVPLCGALAGWLIGLGWALLAGIPEHSYLYSVGRFEPLVDRALGLAVGLGAPLDRGALLALMLGGFGALGGLVAGGVLGWTALSRWPAIVVCPLLGLLFAVLGSAGFLALWTHRDVAEPLGSLLPTLVGLGLWGAIGGLLLGVGIAAIGQRRASLALGVALLLGLLGLWLARPVALEPAAARLGPIDPPRRLLFIGLDAGSWANMDPLIEAGRLPRIAELRERGTSGELRSLSEYFSPSLWTTMVTGVHPREHGILDFAKGKVPYTSNSRTRWAVWEILPLFGQRSAFHYWWSSWPAEPVAGRIVTDRLLDRDLAQRIHPPEDVGIVDAIADEALLEAPALGTLLGGGALSSEFQGRHEKRLAALTRSLKRDRTVVRLALDALGRDFDLVTAYLRGPDIAGHTCWKWHHHAAYPTAARWIYGAPDPDQEILGPVIARMYEQIDQWVGELALAAGPGTNVLIVSDHGMTAVGPNASSLAADQSGIHHTSGMVLLAGPDIDAPGTVRGASIYDVFPTMLHLLGLPVPDGSRGRVLSEALSSEFQQRPLLRIADLGAREERQTEPVPSGADEKYLEQLEALGYVIE